MKVYFAGGSHLNHYSIVGAAKNGLHIVYDNKEADLIVVAEDTPTKQNGERDLKWIGRYVHDSCDLDKPVILMSQVPPGFCREQNRDNLYHYPETLRIKDAYERCIAPEYIIIGWKEKVEWPCNEVWQYCQAFNCPVYYMIYEEAEMAKVAVNMMLSMQVDYANRMESACRRVGAKWEIISEAIRNDKRIGGAYLTPGRWQDSIHLLRDFVTLTEIERA